MPLTKVTNIVLEDNPTFTTINGCTVSVTAGVGKIPRANASGVLDASWGVAGGSGAGTGDMVKSTYDTNNNGVVDLAEAAQKISIVSTANKFWGTNASNVQGWIDLSTLVMTKATYDPTSSGKVTAAVTSDKLAGSPAANKLWGTDSVGIQGWISTLNGDMSRAVYDTNLDGIVDIAEVANGLANPQPNRIWGTNSLSAQQWFNVNPANIMTTTNYGSGSVTGLAVELANKATIIDSAQTAANNTVYGKDAFGTVSWMSIGSVLGDLMSKSNYADSDTTVKTATVALNVIGYNTAANNTYYGKDSGGNTGWYAQVNATLYMQTSAYAQNATQVKSAKVADELLLANNALANSSITTPTVFGCVKTETNTFCNFTNIEQFITRDNYIKASWCGFKVTATGNNSLATFSNFISNDKQILSYVWSGANLTPQTVDLYEMYKTAKIDVDNQTIFSQFPSWVKVTYYNVTNTGTAQLKLNGATNISPNVNYFTSVPIKFDTNDTLTLSITGNAVFEFYLEFC